MWWTRIESPETELNNLEQRCQSLVNSSLPDNPIGMTANRRLVTKHQLEQENQQAYFPWLWRTLGTMEDFSACQQRLHQRLQTVYQQVHQTELSPEKLAKITQKRPTDQEQTQPESPKSDPLDFSTPQITEIEVDQEKITVEQTREPYPNPHSAWLWGGNGDDIQRLQCLDYQVVTDAKQVNKAIRDAQWDAAYQQRSQNSGSLEYRYYNPYDDPDEDTKDSIPQFESAPIEGFTKAGLASAKGRRKTMEDAHLVTRFTIQAGGQEVPVSLAGVFDGHGGHQASQLVADNLVKALTRRLEQYNSDGLTDQGIWNALRLAMVDLDRMVTEHGTTACVSLVMDGNLWTANVGDSRALFTCNNGKCLQLSTDAGIAHGLHMEQVLAPQLATKTTPFPGGERREFIAQPEMLNKHAAEVIRRGGEFLLLADHYAADEQDPDGFDHVDGYICQPKASSSPPTLGFTSGGVNMLHSLGDHHLGGVTPPIATITRYPVTKDMEWLLIGCDGIYECISTSQLAAMVERKRQENPAITGQQLAEAMVTHAYSAGSGDNLSAVAIPIGAMTHQARDRQA